MDFHSMKRKKLQALCKKHKIPANLRNLEMANRLTSLLMGKDGLFTERRSCLKALDENGCEIGSDVENKRVKKVRFSPDTEMFEFEQSEPRVFEVKRRGTRKPLINEVSIVENVSGPELSEGVGYPTRSRGRRLLEKGVSERKGGKGGVKDDALGSKLPSVVDNITSIYVDNEESRVMTRRSLRKRVVEEGKNKKDDMEKGLKKKGRERNLRQGKEARDNVAEIGESDVECVEIRSEKVLRMSERNVTKVEDYKLMNSGAVATGSSLKSVDSAACEGSGPYGLEIDVAMEEKDRFPVGVAMRRSRRNASRNEPLIIVDDLVAEVNYERKIKKQRRDPVKEQEAVLIDSINIELPLAPSSPHVKRSEKVSSSIVAGKSAKKAREKSNKQTVEIEDSLPEDLTAEELSDADVQSSLAEVAEGAIARDSDNEGLIDDLKKQEKRSGNHSSRKSPPKALDISKAVNGEITASESTEFNVIEPGIETSHGRINVVDQSDTTDPTGMQLWVELSIDMETMSRPASLDHLMEDEGSPGDKSQEYIERQGLESVRGDVLERYENSRLHGPCERDGSTSSVKDKTCELNPANSEDSNPNYNGDRSILSLDRALEHKDLSLSMQTNGGEVDNVARDRNIDQEAMKRTMSDKSDENNPSVENCDASDKFYESNFAKPSRGVTSMLEDGNVNGREDSEEPVDLKGKLLRPPSKDANITETNCTQIEYSTCISSSGNTTNVLKLNLTSEGPEKSGDVMYLDKKLEPRKQSLSIQRNDVGLDDAAGAEKHFIDAKISAELPKFDEENFLGEFLEPNPFDSSGCLGMLGVLDANAGKDLVGDVDSECLVVADEDFASDTIDESHKSYEDEPEKDGDADLIEPCIRETEKVDYNFGEPTKVDESVSAVNLNTTLEQREQSPIAYWKGCEGGCEAKEYRKCDQVEQKCDELSISADDRPLNEQYHFLKKCWKSSISDTFIRSDRSTLQDEIDDCEDSVGLQKNAAGPKESYDTEHEKDEKVGFIQSCVREECTSAKRGNNYKENSTDSDNDMAAMKCGTGNFPCVSILHNNEEASSPMNLDISLEQRENSPVVDRYECEADSGEEANGNYGQVELKSDELSKSFEDRPFDEKYHFPRSIPQGDQDSLQCQKNTTCSRKTFEDGPDKDGNKGFTDSYIIKKCNSVQINDSSEEVPVYSKNPIGAIVSATGIFLHIPLVDNNEDTGSWSSDMALDQREKTPILLMNRCHADNEAEDDRSCDQLDLYCDESGESLKDKCLKEHCSLPNKCLLSNVSYPSRKANSMLQDEIIKVNDDSMSQEKSFEIAPEDGNAGPSESYVMDRYTTAKNYEDNPENPKRTMEEISRTSNSAHIPMVDNNEDYISTMNLEITLEKRVQSLVMEQNGFDTDVVAEENENHEHKELNCDESAKCQMPSASGPSRGIFEDKSANAVERICSTTEFSSSISNFGGTDPLDSTPTLDGPEFKEVSGDANTSGHPTFPDTSAQKRENIIDVMDEVADAFKTCDEVNNSVDLASSETGNSNAEDVTKFQEVVLAVQRCASYVNEGDKTFSDNRKEEDSNWISEKTSDFATELSETKLNINNFQEEFNGKDQDNNGKENRENLAVTFSLVQFTIPDIHSEGKTLDIADDVSSKLYMHHEVLKESDVADTINEYIESESTMDPSLGIDDTSDTLHIDVSTKVPEPEDKHAEEIVDATGRKFELSVEKDDQEKNEAANLEETALGSAWISDSKTATAQSKNSDVVADKNSFLGKHSTCEMREKIRAILIHGTPKKLQMVADMKENLRSLKMEKVGCLTTVKPTTKRPALKDFLQKKVE